MKKLVSLILAITVLTALCACAEKMKQITENEARALAMEELWVNDIRNGYNVNLDKDDTVSVGSDRYARVIADKADTWEKWETLLRSVYISETADEILAGDDVVAISLQEYPPATTDEILAGDDVVAVDEIFTYAKLGDAHIVIGSNGFESYNVISISEVVFSENSSARAVADVTFVSSRNGEQIATTKRKIEFENTADGWRIKSPTKPLYEPVVMEGSKVMDVSIFIPELDEIFPNQGRKVTLLIGKDGDGKLLSAQGRDLSGGVICLMSDYEILFYEFYTQQIYLYNINSEECTPLLPDTAFGFTRADYEPLEGKYESLNWCDDLLYDVVDENIIFYKSNKYAVDGVPVLRYAVWFYNIETGEETRIDPPEGEVADGAFIQWYNGALCFETYYGSEDLHYVAQYSYDLATGELTQTSIKYYDPTTDEYYTPETNE